MKLCKLELLKCQGFKLTEKEGRKIIFAYVDETRMFAAESGRVYLDFSMIETPNSEYSDYLIAESSTKEEREAGESMPPIGNAKTYRKPGDDTNTDANVSQDDTNEDIDDLPF